MQLFGAFAKGLTDAVKQGNVGVGIGHSVAACRAVLQDRAGSLSPYAAPGWEDITLAASDFDPMAPTQAIRNLLPPSVPREDALLFLDVVAQWHLLILQFIDDAFVLQSTCRGLLGVCNTMSAFAQLWRHRFASGSKGAAVLCVRDKWPDSLPPPLLDGQPVRIVDQIEILGMSFDEKLSFDGALQKLGSQMCEAASNLGRALDAQGLGLAWHVQQFPNRVEAAALFGCELLVSHFLGWPQVSRKLNSYHYKAIKALLGMTNFSLGDGGYVQLLTWMGRQLEVECQSVAQDSDDAGKTAHHAAKHVSLCTCPSGGRDTGRDLGGSSACACIGTWNPADPVVGVIATGGVNERGHSWSH